MAHRNVHHLDLAAGTLYLPHLFFGAL